MSEAIYRPRGRYFESFEVGETILTSGRTITETDVVNFAGLSGDFNQIHTDAAHAAGDTFGQRVAHGLLVQAIASGLAVQTGVIEGTVLAFREVECKFSRPLFLGDTIRVKLEIVGTKALPRLGGGNIRMKFNVINQNDEVIQRGYWVMLVKEKPGLGLPGIRV